MSAPLTNPNTVVSGTEAETAVPLPQPWPVTLYHSAAFALSALLSPYLIIPVGTVGIVAAQPASKRQFILWTSLSVFFSTIMPALYVVIQVLRGKITDVHVMEREQRGGPFFVGILSSFIGAVVLWLIHAPPGVWSIMLVLAVNGVILLGITSVWKISMHVAVLSATVLAALIMIPDVGWWRLVWLIPALIWARVTRQRHTVTQGISACIVAGLVTGTILAGIHFWPIMAPRLSHSEPTIRS